MPYFHLIRQIMQILVLQSPDLDKSYWVAMRLCKIGYRVVCYLFQFSLLFFAITNFAKGTDKHLVLFHENTCLV